MMSNPFDYINSINMTKKHMMQNTDNDELAEKAYNPFLTNRALSYFNDTLALANEMNCNSSLDNLMQYEFYFYLVPKKKRFSKWQKKSNSDRIDVITEYYACSERRAHEYNALLTDEHINHMKKTMIHGG